MALTHEEKETLRAVIDRTSGHRETGAATRVVPEDVVWQTIEHKLGKKPKLLPLNKQAFEAGLKIGKDAR